MKLAFSSNAYMQFSIEETMLASRRPGYTGIEILADVPHAWPAGFCRSGRSRFASTLEKHGLAISNVNGFMMNAVADPRQPYWHPWWTEPDRTIVPFAASTRSGRLKLAAELGAPNITTEPGGLLPPEQSWDAAAEDFLRRADALRRGGRACRGGLLIEPEPDLMIETFRAIRGVHRRIDSPWVGLNFDIGHAYCVGEDPQDWVERMRRTRAHYHFEDIAASRVHQHLIPGHGAIDFPATVAAIQKPATTALSPSNCIRTSRTPTRRRPRRKNFSFAPPPSAAFRSSKWL